MKYYKKYFFLGPGRNATTTIHKMFLDVGKKSLHNKFWADDARLHLTCVFDEYDVFTDCHYRCDFKWLDEKFGDSALFVLNYRNLDEWLVSRWNMVRRIKNNPNAVRTQRRDPYTGQLVASKGDLDKQLSNQWLQEYVYFTNLFRKGLIEYFKNRNNFICLNVSDSVAFSDFANSYIKKGLVVPRDNARSHRVDFFRSPEPVREALSALKISPEDYSKVVIDHITKPLKVYF